MRSSVAARLSKALSLFCTVALCCGLIPIAAYAAQPNLSLIPEGEQGAAPIVSGAEGGDDGSFSHYGSDDALSVDGDSAAYPSEDVIDTGGDDVFAASSEITVEEVPSDAVVARAESVRSFFLAETLGNTRSVPMVSAELPIGGDAAEEIVGSFEWDGMTFAIEAGGDAVALIAVDYAKLPEEFVTKQILIIPEMVSPDGIDSYSVIRIANDAFAGLTEASANSEYVGCKVLFEDEDFLAEAGIDSEEVARYLNEVSVTATAQDGGDVGASFDRQTQDEGGAYGEEPSSNLPASEVRTIVSMEGDVATLDDGSVYRFTNPLAGRKGILALAIPTSVSEIEDDAFSGFETLQYIVISKDNPEYASYDGVLYDASLSELLLVPEGRTGTVRIATDVSMMNCESVLRCSSVDTLILGSIHDVSNVEVISSIGSSAGKIAFLIGEAIKEDESYLRSFQDIMGVYAACRSLPDSLSAERGEGHGESVAVADDADISSRTSLAYTQIGFWIFPEGGVVTGAHGGAITEGTWYDYVQEDTRNALYDDPACRIFVIGLNGEGIHIVASRTGYTMRGWAYSSGAANVLPAGTRVTHTQVLYAQWKANQYQVSFDANGGSGGQSANVTATYDAAMPAISAVAPTREGYRFGGWYDTTGSSAGTQYYTAEGASARTWNKTADTTLYARWIADLSWTNEGSNGASDKAKFPDSVCNVSGEDSACSVVAPDPGARRGYDFSGWAVYEADGTTLRDDNGGSFYQVGSTIPVKGHASIQAQWTEVDLLRSAPEPGSIYAVGLDEKVYEWFGVWMTGTGFWQSSLDHREAHQSGNMIKTWAGTLSWPDTIYVLHHYGQNKGIMSHEVKGAPQLDLSVSGPADFRGYAAYTLNPATFPKGHLTGYDAQVASYMIYGQNSGYGGAWNWREFSSDSVMALGSEPFVTLYPGEGKVTRFWQYGGEETERAVPDDPGKVFVGWFDAAQSHVDPYEDGSYVCGGLGDELGSAVRNVPALNVSYSTVTPYYAHYMPDGHDVVFDANGGSHPEGTGVEVPVIWVKHGSVLPENLKTGETPNPSDDLYAKPYDHASESYEEAANASDKRIAEVVATSRIGYRFDGYWTTRSAESGSEVIDGRTVEAKQYYGANMEPMGAWSENDLATTTLYAHWSPITYGLSFDLGFEDAAWKEGEGPAQGAYEKIVYDTAVTLPKAPVRAGWTFDAWVATDDASERYAAEETVNPANFASEQDAVAIFEAHWVKNLDVIVPLGSKDVDMAVSADLVDGTAFDIDKGVAEIVNLSDGELKVVSVREDVSDPDALAARRANALEAFGGTTSDASKLDAVSFVLRPTSDGTTADASKEEARFALFGSHAFETDSWRIPASTDPVNGTTSSTLRILYDMAFDYSKIAITDLKLNLEAKPISSLIYTVELADTTVPSYGAGA